MTYAQSLGFTEPINSELICKGCSNIKKGQFKNEESQLKTNLLKSQYFKLVDSLLLKKYPFKLFDYIDNNYGIQTIIDGNRTRWNFSDSFTIPEVKVCFILTENQLSLEKLKLQRIETVASQWCQLAGVTFKFNYKTPCTINALRDEADIRISFSGDYDGWSLVGTQSKDYDGASMILRRLNTAIFDDRFKRIVLHEFGHALGLLHEHQHPAFSCKFDVEKLKGKYSDTFINENYLPLQNLDGIKITEFDNQSIMLYPFESDDFESDCRAEFPENFVISDKDAKAIQFFYPRTIDEYYENQKKQKDFLSNLDNILTKISIEEKIEFSGLKSKILENEENVGKAIIKIEKMNPEKFNSINKE
jgi:hypothetical protein